MSNESIRIRVAAILIEEKKVLLIAHKKDNKIYWLLPGGGVRKGEPLEEALKRELKEELGINIKVNDVVLICDSIDPNMEKHILNICFFCSYDSGDYNLGNEKRLYDFNFFNKKELESLQFIPPIKDEIIQILSGSSSRIYLGKRWVNQ